jgi:hypothetical protein
VREPSGTCGRATILVSMLPTESFLYLRPMTLQALAKGLDVSSAVRRYKTDLLREDRGIQIRRRPNGIRIEVKPRYLECGTLKREGIHDTKTSKLEVHDLLHRMTSFYLNGRPSIQVINPHLVECKYMTLNAFASAATEAYLKLFQVSLCSYHSIQVNWLLCRTAA